jgi:hypothetical protein
LYSADLPDNLAAWTAGVTAEPTDAARSLPWMSGGEIEAKKWFEKAKAAQGQ